MPRPRLPADAAEVSGAALINAGRFANRKKPQRTRPLGEPYAGMNELEREAWEDFRNDLPWLNSSHRVLVRLASRLTARLNDDTFGVSACQTLSSILSKLGATPTDETKVSYAPDEVEDPADAFFGRSN